MREIRKFWFPWCTSYYIDSYCKEKVAELKASGEFFGVRNAGGQIQVKMGIHPDTGYMATKQELIDEGIITGAAQPALF